MIDNFLNLNKRAFQCNILFSFGVGFGSVSQNVFNVKITKIQDIYNYRNRTKNHGENPQLLVTIKNKKTLSFSLKRFLFFDLLG